VPANVTDLSTATAQIISSNADAVIPILPNDPVLQLLNEMNSQGVTLDKVAVISTSINVTPGVLKKWGSVANGLYLIGGAAPINDLSNTGIAQMVDEIKASGGSPDDQSDRGVAGWSGIHVMAEVMKDSSTFDSATFASKIRSLVVDRPELPKIDFSKPAYSDATLSKLRIFTSQAILERVVDGQSKVVTSGGFVSTETTFTVSQ
jgi:ABC-type branched-subunit amino acid transport system substrate-binding protein